MWWPDEVGSIGNLSFQWFARFAIATKNCNPLDLLVVKKIFFSTLGGMTLGDKN